MIYVVFSFQFHSPRSLLRQDWCKYLIIVANPRRDASHLVFMKLKNCVAGTALSNGARRGSTVSRSRTYLHDAGEQGRSSEAAHGPSFAPYRVDANNSRLFAVMTEWMYIDRCYCHSARKFQCSDPANRFSLNAWLAVYRIAGNTT